METNKILLEILQTLKQIEENTRPKKKSVKKEAIENQQIGLEVKATPKVYGNKDITVLLEAIRQTVRVDDFKETKQMQRNFGKHLNTLLEKIGREEFRSRLDKILNDSFKRKNCNSLKYLYGEIKSCLPESMTGQNISKF